MNKSFVYGLRRIGSNEIRYVGQTRLTPEKRFKRHVRIACCRKKNVPIYDWIRKHLPDIEFVILKENAIWNIDEQILIAKFRQDGHRLLNLTSGGDGHSNYKRSVETIERQRVKMIRFWKDLQARENQSLKLKKIWESSEYRKKRIEWLSKARHQISKSVEKRWKDQTYQQRHAKGMKKNRGKQLSGISKYWKQVRIGKIQRRYPMRDNKGKFTSKKVEEE